MLWATADARTNELLGSERLPRAPALRTMKLRRNALFGGLEAVVAGIGLFLIYRNVVQELGVAMLGVWSLVLATTAFGRAADIGISAGLARFVAKAIAQDQADLATLYMRTGAIAVGVTMAAVALLGSFPLWWALGLALKGDELAQARAVLPWAVLTFWLLNLKAVADACLLGVQRSDLRSLGSLIAMLVQLAASLAWVGRHGLQGLAWAQALQYLPALALGAWFVRRYGPALQAGQSPGWFSWPVLRELLGFGIKLQVGTIANLLFEPACKIVLGSIAGTTVLGLFEMAYRMVYQVRSVAIMALQTTVPAFAEQGIRAPENLPELFSKVCRTAAWVATPLMLTVALASPWVAGIWIGHDSPAFVFLTAGLTIMWTVNILAAPAYFLGMAEGRLIANVGGQVLSGVLAPLCVYLIGLGMGGLPAALGVALGKIPGDLMPAAMNRPSGRWSHAAILNINNILAILLVSGVCGVMIAQVGPNL